MFYLFEHKPFTDVFAPNLA